MIAGVTNHNITPLRYQYSLHFIADKLNKRRTKNLKHGCSFLDVRLGELRLPEINVYRFTYIGFRKVRISIYRVKNKYKGFYNQFRNTKSDLVKRLNKELRLYKPFKSVVYNVGDLNSMLDY